MQLGGRNMPLLITKKDITSLKVDAIANAANRELKNYAVRRGGGVCGAIFRAAGNEEMQAACDKISFCETGCAVVTSGFALPAKYVIHAVGPKYSEGDARQEALLRSCYTTALDIATDMELETVAFPLISSGIYGYPKSEALQIALSAIQDWLDNNGDQITVSLCLMDEAVYTEAASCINTRNKQWKRRKI